MTAIAPVDIIIPTFNNYDQLFSCLQSIYVKRNRYPVRFIIVNNGEAHLDAMIPEYFKEACLIITPAKNLGWTGGLIEGLKYSTSKYVMFANDDIFVPRSSSSWLADMVRKMDLYDTIGAIGPSSNCVMGLQNIFNILPCAEYSAMYLIGYCILVRRKALDEAGGVQPEVHGGDDIDLSIRLRKAGYTLVVDRETFVYHHGFQTGTKVYGDSSKPNGWNSREMIEDTNMELIRKHGFLEWYNTIRNNVPPGKPEEEDMEGKLIAGYVNEGVVIEMGCGGNKTIGNSIGVDIIPKGELIEQINAVSVADICADVTGDLPFEDNYADVIIARHVLEHCINHVGTLVKWNRILKSGGKFIIACPDERIRKGVPLNPEHVHAFTPESLDSVMELLCYRKIGEENMYNNVSFIRVYEKAWIQLNG